jgi:large subunit ribosomal protein L21
MYAVIKSGGKQYRVEIGHVLKLETLPIEAGSTVEFSDVLMFADDKETVVGAPLLTNVSVKADVLSHGRHKKIRILKFRRRKHHMKRMGHRQNYTEVKITAITKAA